MLQYPARPRRRATGAAARRRTAAANYITALPRKEAELPEWQAAIEALVLVAENGGPMMFARIGVMRALNRHIERVFNTDRRITIGESGSLLVTAAVFYIQKGRVKLTVLSEQGKEAVVGILEPGQFFGEGCLNGHPLRIATTTAMEECMVTSITKEAMIATLHTESKFSELFMA
jgi:Cyclic nucleotide-binding domain